MPLEIERKFLIANEGWRAHAGPGIPMRQGYVANTPQASVRVRLEGSEARLNIKSATRGVSRLEFEYLIPPEEAREMLERLCTRPQVEKTRYPVRHAGHHWEVDVFEGANAGLVVAELELEQPDEPFERPSWVGAEVTDDLRYYNVSLVSRPYSSWERD